MDYNRIKQTKKVVYRWQLLVMMLAFGLLLALPAVPVAQAATTWYVDDDNCPGPGTGTLADPFCKIQDAIDTAVSGDTIEVADGTYSENLVLAKQLTLNGAQAGVDARGRAASESTITDAGGGTLLELKGGSAGSIIDGFTFSGGSRGIESSSGPIDNLQILNNRFDSQTSSAVFLNDNGEDITVNQNVFDGSSSGGGGFFHLDTDNFDGFHFTNNNVINGVTGFFVDGNRNVGSSANRSPLFANNLFEMNLVGINLGKRALEGGEIRDNAFNKNSYDGLQGGPKDVRIHHNRFSENGRFGLAFTSFGDSDPAKGAQGNTVDFNCFIGNGVERDAEAVFFSSGQAANTISTNVLNNNNIVDNNVGASYSGSETINAENNWWGAANGPSGDGPGSGDSVDGQSGGGTIDFDPWLATPADTPQPCGEEPTAISLASFEVEANDGRAMILWETGTEIDNAGFNLYRAPTPDGPWVQINSGLIAAEGDPVSGASYNFVDTPGRGAFYYRLEDIDYFGVVTQHQPVQAQLGPTVRVPWFRPSLPQFD